VGDQEGGAPGDGRAEAVEEAAGAGWVESGGGLVQDHDGGDFAAGDQNGADPGGQQAAAVAVGIEPEVPENVPQALTRFVLLLLLVTGFAVLTNQKLGAVPMCVLSRACA
jgi:hypothetical protein